MPTTRRAPSTTKRQGRGNSTTRTRQAREPRQGREPRRGGSRRDIRGGGGGRSDNPYRAPRGDRDRGRGASRGRRGRNQGSGQNLAGMVSFICGLVSSACFLGLIASVGLVVSGDFAGGFGLALIMIGFFWIAVLVGVGTGIAGVAKSKAPKGLAITGLIINGLWLSIMLLNMVLKNT